MLALAAVAAGCGDGESATDALSKTAGNMGKIRSGVMAVDVSAKGRGGGKAANLGFHVDGPFALARKGGLPVAKLRYTQVAGSQRASATFISTGREAFVEAGGQARRLPPAQARELRAAAGDLTSDGGVRELRLDRWMRDPKLEDGISVGGDETDRVTAGVDVHRALADLGGSLGGGAQQLERAVKRARVEVLTGRKDRLLRRLTLDVDLALDVPKGLRQRLGDLVGGEVRLAFEIRDPNRKVTVRAPATTG